MKIQKYYLIVHHVIIEIKPFKKLKISIEISTNLCYLNNYIFFSFRRLLKNQLRIIKLTSDHYERLMLYVVKHKYVPVVRFWQNLNNNLFMKKSNFSSFRIKDSHLLISFSKLLHVCFSF